MKVKVTNKQIEELHISENKLNKENNQLDKKLLQLNDEIKKAFHRKKKIAKAISWIMKRRNKLINELAKTNKHGK